MLYFFIFIALLGIELGFLKIAEKSNIVVKPSLRGSHTFNIPTGSGIIFPVSTIIWYFVFGGEYTWFLMGLILISAVSFIDDIRPLSIKIRLIVQFIAVCAMFRQWGIFNVDSWLIILAALVFCTGIINAYNFMDGINGITGGYSLAVIIPLLLLNARLAFIEQSYLIVSALAVLVFCFFNFRKRAKCFAGDVGSVSIAFIILFALGTLILKSGNIWYLMFLAVYGVDSILTIIHRLMLKENIFEAHRKHAYQLIANELRMPHITVSSIYMTLQLAISFGLIYSSINIFIYSASVLVSLIIGYSFVRRLAG